jgi:hypothetical protein
MRIYDFIEGCHLDRHQLTDDLRGQIPRAYSEQEWIKLAQLFVAGLDRHHQVPGKIIYNILGICEYFKLNQSLTNRQRHYLANSLVDYWNNLGIESRARIYY